MRIRTPTRSGVLRGVGADGKVQQKEVYATIVDASGKSLPFGINFYPANNPKWVYVANTVNVVRFPYKTGDPAREWTG